MNALVLKRCGKADQMVFATIYDGGQLAEIGKLHEAGKIRRAIDKALPFGKAKGARAYLGNGRVVGRSSFAWNKVDL